MFADADAGDVRGDLLELAPVGVGRVRFEIEGVHVAGTAGQPDENRGPALGVRGGLPGVGESHVVGQAEARAGEGSYFEEIAAGEAVAEHVVCHDGGAFGDQWLMMNSLVLSMAQRRSRTPSI